MGGAAGVNHAARIQRAQARLGVTFTEQPAEFAYLADYLTEFSAGTVTWASVQAWCGMTGRRLAAWEVSALMTLDLIRVKGIE